jgi:hypothetical protein
MLAPPERVTIFTPLGIRFWDAAKDVPVKDGLMVTARSGTAPYSVVSAFRTRSGVYAFQGLPGLRHLEYPDEGGPLALSPPAGKRFLIEVTDTEGRYLPVTFGVDVPYQGIFPSGAPTSPPGNKPPGFYLFSAPTRTVTPELAAVRAQLEDRATQKPAGHAVLEIQAPGDQTWYGLADERGCIAVLFPYPTFTSPLHGSPPAPSPPEGDGQSWHLNIRVRYSPPVLSLPPGGSLPYLQSILSQAPGSIWSSVAVPYGQPLSWVSAELFFGQELVLRTDARSTLVISAGASPP